LVKNPNFGQIYFRVIIFITRATDANARPATTVMDLHVARLTNVPPVAMIVTPMPPVEIPMAVSSVFVKRVMSVMVAVVPMSMNVAVGGSVHTTPNVKTHVVALHVAVNPGLSVMASHVGPVLSVRMSTNVQLARTTAMPTPHAKITKADIDANVIRNMKAMGKVATESTNV